MGRRRYDAQKNATPAAARAASPTPTIVRMACCCGIRRHQRHTPTHARMVATIRIAATSMGDSVNSSAAGNGWSAAFGPSKLGNAVRQPPHSTLQPSDDVAWQWQEVQRPLNLCVDLAV